MKIKLFADNKWVIYWIKVLQIIKELKIRNGITSSLFDQYIVEGRHINLFLGIII